MAKFLDFNFKVTEPQGQNALAPDPATVQKRLFENAKPMAKRMSEAYANNLKTTLARVRAIATGGTIRSVRDEMLLESPSRGLIMRRVVASKSIFWVQHGRRPGKAPIRFVGMRPGINGKKPIKWFEPLPALIVWFNALSIRQALWMPIARAIGRRGIKPREVQMRSVRATSRAWQEAVTRFGADFARSIFKK